MSCSEAVKSGEAVEGDEADEGLPVDHMPQSQCPHL